jgi:hypothetical protein
MVSTTEDRRFLKDRVEELLSAPRKDFSPVAHYSAHGDFLKVLVKPDAAISERIDETLTIYRSISSNEVVGCKIKGVSILAENWHTLIDVDSDNIQFNFILLAAKPSAESRKLYYDVSKAVGSMTVSLKEILEKKAA